MSTAFEGRHRMGMASQVALYQAIARRTDSLGRRTHHMVLAI